MPENILNKTLRGNILSGEDAAILAANCEWQELAIYSSRIREQAFGKKIKLCTIINAKSGACDMNCCFCSQSSAATGKINIYELLGGDELTENLNYAVKNEATSCGIVTSGGKLDEKDIYQIGTILKNFNNEQKIELCGSLGRLRTEDLRYLKGSGLNRIHHNLETSKEYYGSICTSQSWESRVETIKTAQKEGFKVCSGGLFGVGESWSDRISLAQSLRECAVDSIPVNFLIPQRGTAFEATETLTPAEALKIIALFRLMLPRATIRVCGGRKTLLEGRHEDIITAGANAFMTGNYLTTDGIDPVEDKKNLSKLGMEY